LDLIAEMVEKKARELEIEPRAVQFNRRDIREHTGWSDNQIKAHIKRIEELELLTVKAGEQGRMYRYSLGSWEVVGDKLGAGEVRDCAENIGERLAVVGKLAVSGKGA
jgi:hypothetical protein